MTPEETKEECNLLYKQIEYCHERLKVIREECKHEKTFRGTYSWRIGAFDECDICEYCGAPVNFIDQYIIKVESENNNP